MYHSNRFITLLLSLFLSTALIAQHKTGQAFSLAITNHQSAYPFNKLGALIAKEKHLGFEVGYAFNWKTGKKHDWSQTFKAGYFYHRFVQHAIPLYTQLGYHYKLKEHWRLGAALGVGYLHSISDMSVLSMNEAGEYEKDNGIGRPQVLINLTFHAQYNFKWNAQKQIAVFLQYQQQLQTPFINSYVPLLPYNALGFGVKMPIKNASL
jgi:hypothetical protein